MKLIKNITLGISSIFKIFVISLIINTFFTSISNSTQSTIDLQGDFIEIKILDKVSSKNQVLKIKIGEEIRYKNILIKSLKCRNSKFDDNPEVTAYLQVKDLTNKDNNEVYVFNGWTFSSSPTVRPFDHPVYDIWLTKCY